MPRGLPKDVKVHLEKARESSLLAVEVYNKPSIRFRSGGFIVFMCIAWTSFFHAAFFRRKVKPFYRDPDHPSRYLKIEGDYKAWELGECLKQYYGDSHPAERQNLRFFIGLRNKIEHRSMPALDTRIFGECQALLFNFEDALFREFGAKHMLHETPALALQFSHLRDENQTKAISRLRAPLAEEVAAYVESFRSSLGIETINDMRYCYKVFLIPKLVNHPEQADTAVEFVKYDPSNPEEMAKYEKLVAFIKPTVTQVVNPGHLKPGDICRAVEPVVQQVVGPKAKFNPSHHHVRAWHFYRVRPRKGDGDARNTKTQFCHYDEAHRDYVYTKAWQKFLIGEMKKPGQYEEVMRKGAP